MGANKGAVQIFTCIRQKRWDRRRGGGGGGGGGEREKECVCVRLCVRARERSCNPTFAFSRLDFMIYGILV